VFAARYEGEHMLTPEEIEAKGFAITRRGYDPDQVTMFLLAVAADQRELRNAPPPEAPKVDLESQVGVEVAEILRTARLAAESTAEESQRAAAAQRAELVRHVADTRAEAHRLADQAAAEAEQLLQQTRVTAAALVVAARDEAAALVAQARAEADDMVQEALLRQERVEAANRTSLSALGQVERQVADLRLSLEATAQLSQPAAAALDEAAAAQRRYSPPELPELEADAPSSAPFDAEAPSPARRTG
jgi:DivIVA domain-containing protein